MTTGVPTCAYLLLSSPSAGYLVIVYQEGKDLASYMGNLLQSDAPFDRWFAEQLEEVHGLDPSQPPPRIERIF
jgi:hypothetical protein